MKDGRLGADYLLHDHPVLPQPLQGLAVGQPAVDLVHLAHGAHSGGSNDSDGNGGKEGRDAWGR